MKRDMNLMRKILFKIEEEYKPGAGFLRRLNVESYEMLTIAEHCDLLYQAGLIKSYKASHGDNTILTFFVGNLTNRGYEYLEQIRNEDIWAKTEKEIEEKKLPKTLEMIAKIAGIFTGNVIGEMNG